MAEIDPNSNDNPRLSPTKARQGDRTFMNARVLLFSLGLLLTIGVIYFVAAWAWPVQSS